jgi:hypothetical protein
VENEAKQRQHVSVPVALTTSLGLFIGKNRARKPLIVPNDFMT